MTLAGRFLVLLLAAALGGCSTLEVQTDYDPTADFSGFKTWAWVPGRQAETGDPRLDNAILDGRIRRAVEIQLAEQGFQKASASEPDFLVGYLAAIEGKLDVQTVDRYYGYGPGPARSYRYPPRWRSGGVYGSETYVYEYEEGTLILDVVSPRTRQLVWRGSATAEVNQTADQERRDERLREAVRKMLERFPPTFSAAGAPHGRAAATGYFPGASPDGGAATGGVRAS
jgi:hypothetical protein